ncbi:hypothetical protein Trydic_g937 [Trypoxylus dichotomus]
MKTNSGSNVTSAANVCVNRGSADTFPKRARSLEKIIAPDCRYAPYLEGSLSTNERCTESTAKHKFIGYTQKEMESQAEQNDHCSTDILLHTEFNRGVKASQVTRTICVVYDPPWRKYSTKIASKRAMLIRIGHYGELWPTDHSRIFAFDRQSSKTVKTHLLKSACCVNICASLLAHQSLAYQQLVLLVTKKGIFTLVSKAEKKRKGNSPSRKSIKTSSDNQAALRVIRVDRISSRFVADCEYLFNLLNSNNKVTLVWIPEHTGIEVKETADTFAKIGGS